MQQTDRARFSKKNLGAEILGVLGVKNDPFGYCSSLSLTILLKISQKLALLKTFPTLWGTPTEKLSLTLYGENSTHSRHSIPSPGAKKIDFFFDFFLRIESFWLQKCKKKILTRFFAFEITLIQDLEFFFSNWLILIPKKRYIFFSPLWGQATWDRIFMKISKFLKNIPFFLIRIESFTVEKGSNNWTIL